MSPTVARGRTEGRAGKEARGGHSAHGGDCNSHFCAVKVFEAGCSLESIGVIKEESYLEAPALVPPAAVVCSKCMSLLP